MSAHPSSPHPGWENYPNLRRRPHSPNKGRGRLQRQIARCFVVFGPEVSSSRLLDWCYARDPRVRHRWSVVRVLRQIADPIGRAETIGRPVLWRLKTPGVRPASVTRRVDP